jgi:UDPglucose--hexose-1-phosphate uridylyltransferase
MRRHYFLEEYCIIAAERRKRPSNFRRERGTETSDPRTCPFCPGNEEMTPPAVAVYTDEGVGSDGDERSGTGGPDPSSTSIRR